MHAQEEGARHRSADAEPIRTAPNRMTEISLDSESDDDPPPLHPVPELEPWQLHSIATGDLAGVIAASAERQAVEGDTTSSLQPSLPDLEVDHRVGELSIVALEYTENEPEMYQRVGDQSSEVEVGDSFASSVPSASEFVSETRSAESSGGVNFEEQMLLAMALSIADAQTSRVHQGDSRSGPLLQPAPMGH